MTYTKRQWFIYRLRQSLNLLNKTSLYMNDVYDYVKDSKYKKRVKKRVNQINDCIIYLSEFLLDIDCQEVE